MIRVVLMILALVALGLGLAPGTEALQTGDAPRQMRHFWHVFAAYALAWLLVFGWAASIARRLKRVEDRLDP